METKEKTAEEEFDKAFAQIPERLTGLFGSISLCALLIRAAERNFEADPGRLAVSSYVKGLLFQDVEKLNATLKKIFEGKEDPEATP